MKEQLKNKAAQIIGSMTADIKAISFIQTEYIDLMSEVPQSRLPKSLRGKSKGIKKNSAFLASHVIYLRPLDSAIDFIVTYKARTVLSNMSPLSTSGLDIYSVKNNKYLWQGCYAPNNRNEMLYSFTISNNNINDLLCIIMPGYAQLSHLFIKRSCAEVVDYKQYKGEISLYGSSITQGCAASRPGLCFANLLMTQYGYKVNNYGFSESAKGENDIIDYIASRHSQIYVLEYDHNASIDELKATHERAYQRIREKNPDAAIIMMSRISAGKSISYEEEETRFRIIQNTYRSAVNKGDLKVSCLRGRDLVGENTSLYLEDDRHPNDEGMKLIASAIFSEICRLGVKE